MAVLILEISWSEFIEAIDFSFPHIDHLICITNNIYMLKHQLETFDIRMNGIINLSLQIFGI